MDIKKKNEYLLVFLLNTGLYLLQYIITPLLVKNETIEKSLFIIGTLAYLLYVLIKNIKYEALLLGFIYYSLLMLIYVVHGAMGLGYYYSLAHGYTYDTFWGFMQKLVLIVIQFMALHGGIFLKKIIIFVYYKFRPKEVIKTEKTSYDKIKIVVGYYLFLYIIGYLLMPIVYPAIFGGKLEGFGTFIIVSVIDTLIAYNIDGVDIKSWLIGLMFFFILSPIWVFTTYSFGRIKPPFIDLRDINRLSIILLNIYGCIIAIITLLVIKLFNKIRKNMG
jgi:hypothetical protein